MSLEATMLVLDNSSYSINGDYAPNRLSAQADAVHVIFNRKVNANPENEVGLMVMAGKGPEVLVTPTQDEGKLIAALHNTKQGGDADISTGIQVAQLALKHRQNKNQRQRIIVFVGSPISASIGSLVKLGKKMKKNNVAIDIVSFGSDSTVDLTIPSFASTSESASTASSSSLVPPAPETNEEKLQALYSAVNSSDNSHFLTVEPGPHLLSERISASAILRGDAGDSDDFGGLGGSGGAGGGAGDEYGGIDPNLDPELAMALRMSLEEERARQAAAASAAAPVSELPSVPEVEAAAEAATAAGVPSHLSTGPEPVPVVKKEGEDSGLLRSSSFAHSSMTTEATSKGDMQGVDASSMATGPGAAVDADEGEDDLAKALALSQGDDVEMGAGEGASEGEGEDEDAEIARAIALSMEDEAEETK